MSEAKEKPFPMPGTMWRWTGNELAPARDETLTVTSLRWFRGHCEAMFGDGKSCAGIGHMMTVDAWSYVCTS